MSRITTQAEKTMEAILIPVKRFDEAKLRLAGVLGPGARRRLALSMLGDVLAAAAGWPLRVLVTSDADAARPSRGHRPPVRAGERRRTRRSGAPGRPAGSQPAAPGPRPRRRRPRGPAASRRLGSPQRQRPGGQGASRGAGLLRSLRDFSA